MSFTELYPTPVPETANANQVAGHYAAHALYLRGRADRRHELHGGADATYLHVLSLADSEAEIAYILYAAEDSDADEIASRLLVTQEAVGAHREWAHTIAKRAGYSPAQVRRAGYES